MIKFFSIILLLSALCCADILTTNTGVYVVSSTSCPFGQSYDFITNKTNSVLNELYKIDQYFNKTNSSNLVDVQQMDVYLDQVGLQFNQMINSYNHSTLSSGVDTMFKFSNYVTIFVSLIHILRL